MKILDSVITVVLVEDHKVVTRGIRTLIEFEADIKVIGESPNGLDCIKLIEQLEPMVIIMDISLPKLNGIEASKLLISKNKNRKIIILSAYADDGYIEKALSVGVKGYLLKQCSPQSLIIAIREVAAGKKFFSQYVEERIAQLNMNSLGEEVKKTTTLTCRESQVLQLIAEGKANKQVAYELNISIKTVEKHRQNLMKKLNIHDTAGLTRYAISEGVIENSFDRADIKK